jgi:hypothetical protein
MKKIEAKIYGNVGWIITSEEDDVLGFIWRTPKNSYPFRYETFGVYSESGFGESVELCMKYISDLRFNSRI